MVFPAAVKYGIGATALVGTTATVVLTTTDVSSLFQSSKEAEGNLQAGMDSETAEEQSGELNQIGDRQEQQPLHKVTFSWPLRFKEGEPAVSEEGINEEVVNKFINVEVLSCGEDTRQTDSFLCEVMIGRTKRELWIRKQLRSGTKSSDAYTSHTVTKVTVFQRLDTKENKDYLRETVDKDYMTFWLTTNTFDIYLEGTGGSLE